jgi:hypothetical protein
VHECIPLAHPKTPKKGVSRQGFQQLVLDVFTHVAAIDGYTGLGEWILWVWRLDYHKQEP